MRNLKIALLACYTIVWSLLLVYAIAFREPDWLLFCMVALSFPLVIFRRFILHPRLENGIEKGFPSASDDPLSMKKIGFILLMAAIAAASVPCFVFFEIWAFGPSSGDIPGDWWSRQIGVIFLFGIIVPIALIYSTLRPSSLKRKNPPNSR